MKNLKKLLLFGVVYFNCFLLFSQSERDSLKFYSKLVTSPQKETDLLIAYNYFEKNYDINLQSKDTLASIYCLWNMASAEYKMGFYDESEETSIKALKLCGKVRFSQYLKNLKKGIYNHLGILYRGKKLKNKAIELYQKTFKLAQNHKDSITVFNNIANTYIDNEEYLEAKKILQNCLNRLTPKSDTLLKALVLDNLGVVKSKIHTKNGEKELTEALELRKVKKNFTNIHISLCNLSNFHRQNSNFNQAKKYALKSLEIANTLNSAVYKQKSLGLLVDLSNNHLVRLYKRINDSITQLKQRRTNQFALLKYNTAKQKEIAKENELKAQKSELKAEKEKQQRLVYQFGGSFIVLSLIGTGAIYYEKNKKKIVEKVIQTEGRISKTVHDVIANDLYQVMSKLQITNEFTEEVLDDLDKVYHKARNISRDNYVINEEMDFSEVLKDLFDSYRTPDISILPKLDNVNWDNILIHKKNTIYRVLQELMTNMARYSKADLVTIVCKQKGNKLEIFYKDNGVGCDLSKKNGLLNAESRIKSINGKIIFESEPSKGFITKIIV